MRENSNNLVCVVKYSINGTVTDYYIEIIAEAIRGMGYDTIYLNSVKDAAKVECVFTVISTCVDAFYLYVLRKKYIYWSQGIWPEENYMKHHNLIKFVGYSIIEYMALKHACFMIFVSEAMKMHYMKKYKLNFSEKYFVMPCSNEDLHPESFNVSAKYKKNVFCYAGGISTWQCFKETLELYKRIEDKYQNKVELLLLVKDKEYALQQIAKCKIKNFRIDYVAQEQLPRVLADVKFGFVLRKYSSVNSVATPTKITTYISNGVIPIYGKALTGIDEILHDKKYVVCYGDDSDLNKIEKLIDNEINKESVFDEYQQVYSKYYDREKNMNNLCMKLKPFFIHCNR